MERSTTLLATLLIISVIKVKGQISTPCTVSMVVGFTPCINYITGSSANGRSPTASCCDAAESLMNTSMDCACLIVTGNVPFSLPNPINRALAISLPQACNSKSVPLQCKASAVTLPPPGPALFAPPPHKAHAPKALPPIAVSPKSPSPSGPALFAPPPPKAHAPRALPPIAKSPKSPSPSASESAVFAPTPSEMTQGMSQAPEAYQEPEAPEASAPVARQDPTVTSGIRPVLTPASASNSLSIYTPLLLLVLVAITLINSY